MIDAADGGPAIHTAILEPEFFDGVQAIMASRKTRGSSERGRVDESFDPFILRCLLTCGACQRTMTTSMSTKLTTTSAKTAPLYCRCRTPGCGGQIVASEAERLAFEAISEPPSHWPGDVKAHLREYAAGWGGRC